MQTLGRASFHRLGEHLNLSYWYFKQGTVGTTQYLRTSVTTAVRNAILLSLISSRTMSADSCDRDRSLSSKCLADKLTIHAAHIDEVHDVPMRVLIRPIPSVLDEQKVLSLMDAIRVNIFTWFIVVVVCIKLVVFPSLKI